jgi:hypothetical protein
MRDYYGLGAFFNSIDEWGTYDSAHFRPTPTLLLPTAAQERNLAALEQEVERQERRRQDVDRASDPAFRAWLARTDLKPDLPGLVGHYPLDRRANDQLENLANPKNPGSSSPTNTLVPGKKGQALRFTGDDAAFFANVAGDLDRPQPFTVAFWLQTPVVMKEGIVFQRMAGTDTGFHGTELSFDAGRLFFALVRFWPGNAIAVRTRDPLPAKEWVHVAVSYDASGQAQGLHVYLNGKRADAEIVRDRLTKNTEVGGSGLTFGERFRSTGLKDGLIDELCVFDRALTDIEVAQVHDGRSLAEALAHEDGTALRPYFLNTVHPAAVEARLALRQARQRLFAEQTAVAEIMTMEEVAQPRPAYILVRGQYDAPKDRRVDRQTPGILLPLPPGAPKNRLGLARWLTQPNHPLTARVAVNHIWQIFFGRGIVATTENFGTQGALPTHPQLLDRLARDFISSGWNLKALCREVVLSSTYRQRSGVPPALRERDPDNALLARGPSGRLSAEMLRDAALAVGGLLIEKLGGPPTKPNLPSGLWHDQNAFLPPYVPDKGEGLYRRSLYTFWRRTSPPPNMMTFDTPSREVCTVRRQSTSTPLQPLVLLNDPQFLDAARGLGERMLREGGAGLDARLTFAFREGATRLPSARELDLLRQLHQGQLAMFRKDPSAARRYLQTGDHRPAPDLDPVELAAAAVTANAILNLDAALVTR